MNKSIAGAMLTAAATALLLVGSPIQAGTTAEAVKERSLDAETARPGKPKAATTKYCMVEEMTGSRIGKKTCRTRAEWKALGVQVPNS